MAEVQIAIAGISSKLALNVAAECLKDPNIRLRGSCRSVAKLPAFLTQSPQVTLIESGAYDQDSLRSLVTGCSVVICCYYADNKTMVEGQKLLIDICEEQGVARFLASDYTADYTKLDSGDIVLKDPMKYIHTYLSNRSSVKGVHVLVGLMMETFWQYFDVWHPDENKLCFWGTGHETWDLTTYHTVAQYIAAVALDPSAVGIKKFVGQQITIRDIASDIKAVLGVEPRLESRGPLQDIQNKIDDVNGGQNPVAAGMYYTLTGKIGLGGQLDNDRYPHIKVQTFRDFLRSRVG